jgi:hypothetical protein
MLLRRDHLSANSWVSRSTGCTTIGTGITARLQHGSSVRIRLGGRVGRRMRMPMSMAIRCSSRTPRVCIRATNGTGTTTRISAIGCILKSRAWLFRVPSISPNPCLTICGRSGTAKVAQLGKVARAEEAASRGINLMGETCQLARGPM